MFWCGMISYNLFENNWMSISIILSKTIIQFKIPGYLITQQLRNDPGRSVGVITSTQSMWLTSYGANVPTPTAAVLSKGPSDNGYRKNGRGITVYGGRGNCIKCLEVTKIS